ncbi:MAG: aspartate 1-decarboxylase [Candidatus Omnitrophica bacterium]|nr:aspartate 1-decarboxylase [Candidatus Omnitrophota bacterium]MCF7877646.1 aspartate 1-decarboxylase [Candidatus Omnitrophota bacterium]MCF7892295.1 aspartate 1-decarboxylase [Candidatus Omnitrophota bacterium]MCF7895942.1 aspartate 1-decarboxylase [Candidatus Omnitrophota bacterium]MCF7897972.1 aspartate 1-decarboxylase [Candidatus Omnitrophota bacterium]
MIRAMLKSKISYATVVDLKLYYKGSITIDKKLMDAADLCEGERVDVLNLNNGIRLQTYVIVGESGSGAVCLNGPAARQGYKGDKIIVISYGYYGEEELKGLSPKIIEVDDENKIKNT